MRRLLSYLFMALAFMFLAVPVFAQGGEAAGAVNWVAIAAGFSMAIASAVCGLAQGRATAAAAEGLAAIQPRVQVFSSRSFSAWL